MPPASIVSLSPSKASHTTHQDAPAPLFYHPSKGHIGRTSATVLRSTRSCVLDQPRPSQGWKVEPVARTLRISARELISTAHAVGSAGRWARLGELHPATIVQCNTHTTLLIQLQAAGVGTRVVYCTWSCIYAHMAAVNAGQGRMPSYTPTRSELNSLVGSPNETTSPGLHAHLLHFDPRP